MKSRSDRLYKYAHECLEKAEIAELAGAHDSAEVLRELAEEALCEYELEWLDEVTPEYLALGLRSERGEL